jgi:hypothetical protein
MQRTPTGKALSAEEKAAWLKTLKTFDPYVSTLVQADHAQRVAAALKAKLPAPAPLVVEVNPFAESIAILQGK